MALGLLDCNHRSCGWRHWGHRVQAEVQGQEMWFSGLMETTQGSGLVLGLPLTPPSVHLGQGVFISVVRM